MIYMDVDTAVTVPVNVMPLLDDTDFKTRETGVAHNAAGMDLVWNFVQPDGTVTQTAVTPTTGGDYDWSEVGDAMYKIEIPASGGASINNDTEGTGYFSGVCDGVLPWRGPDIIFRAAGLNDLLIEDAYSTTHGLSGSLLDTLSSLASETRDANVLDQFKKVVAIVEHQRGAHTHQPIGSVFFVDPVGGDTHASGNRGGITDPYDSVQDCHDNAVTDSNHDLIILLSGGAAGPTTLTENVTLSKRYLFIRGPGRDFIWTRSGSGDTITVTADGVALEGFQVNTAATGSGNGITVTSADFFKARRLWINNTQGDAIELTDCDNFVVTENHLQASGQSGSGHGIQVVAGAGQTSSYGQISHNYIHDIPGDGIQLDTTGGGANESTFITHNVVEGCTDDGIDIVDSGSTDTIISDNRFGNNATDVEDAGTSTVQIHNQSITLDMNGRVYPADASISTNTFALGTLPTNFAAMVISGAGAVDSLVQGYINNTITETTAGRIAANISVLLDNGDAVSTLTLGGIATVANQATIQAVTNKLDDTLEDNAGTWRFTAAALAEAPSGGGGGGDATLANQTIIIDHLTDIKGSGWADPNDTLKGIRDKIDTLVTTALTGPHTVTPTVNDGTDPIQDARVTLRRNSPIESETIETGPTGVVEKNFTVEPATWIVEVTAANHVGLATTLDVDGDKTPTYSLTPVVISPATDPDLCNVAVDVLNALGEKLKNAEVSVAVTEAATFASDHMVMTTPRTYRTDSDGRVVIPMIRNTEFASGYSSTYKITVKAASGDEKTMDYTVPDAASAVATVIV